jgi:hypothetical protein
MQKFYGMILASWLMESAAEQAKLSCVHFFLTVIGRRISVQFALLCTKPCQHPPNATYTPGATHPFQNIDLTNTILAVVLRQSSPPFACAPTHDARDPSPLCSPSLHLNLTHPHQPRLWALHYLASTHLSCLGCGHPRSRYS